MRPPKAITLDLDDTLWPVLPTIRRAEAKANDWFRIHAPKVLPMFDGSRRAALREAIMAANPDRLHDLGWLRRQQFISMLEQSGEDATRIDDVYDLFIAARQDVELYPGAADALARLAARYSIASVSNGNADLHRIGLGHFFVATVSASEYGAAKPDPGIFHEACRRLGVAPEDTLHIGDDPLTDVIGAQSAGLRAAWINPDGLEWTEPGQPDCRVPDLAALADILCNG